MRISSFAILALVPFTFAGPILMTRGFLDGSTGAALSGVARAVKQNDANPKLTAARDEVVKGLSGSQEALNKIGAQADATGNADVVNLVTDGQRGLSSAIAAVQKIANDLNSGAKPSKDDQKTVVLGTKDLETAVDGMKAAITTPDDQLSKDIDCAIKNVGTLKDGVLNVLAASNISFADLGLPADFSL